MGEGLAALVPAAGAGERLGRGPKAFVELAGRELLAWVVDALQEVADEVAVAVPAGWEARARAVAPGARILTGGATRQETVRGLLDTTRCAYVLIHDAARPFLSPVVCERVLGAARSVGAATASIAVRDTMVDALSGETLDRDRLRAIQTPQAFARDLLQEGHARAESDGAEATDDAALVRRLGREVRLVEGSPWLLKITSEDDLRMAAVLAGAWRES